MRLHNRGVRQDVRELGALLGDVLEDQTSRRAFETVESCRRAAIDYWSGDLEYTERRIVLPADVDIPGETTRLTDQ
ncbi:hypothetical protein [Natrinema sp. SYSU A 869]|uniref:hypothetical protein n=1 Tax=Natrinema sp. SYSU A 869 TaxID=2871694 RepID=UPI001CA3933E|nr:hypothetical protein [Natrinema sp. SYSU A 869]